MGIQIYPRLTKLYDCETLTGWIHAKDELFTDIGRENTYCNGIAVSQEVDNNYKTISSVDLSGQHIYTWLMQWGNFATKGNGGFRMVLGDGTNTKAYHVGGSDFTGFPYGTWNCFVLSVSDLVPSSTTIAGGALSFGAVTQSGFGFNCLSKAVGGAINSFGDICWYGDGLNICSGNSTTPITFQDIQDENNSKSANKAYGIMHEIGGNYFLLGKLVYGSGNTYVTYFKDTNKTVTFADIAVSSNLYEIRLSGAKTVFQLGSKVGIDGVEGCTIQAEGTQDWIFDASSNSISGCRLYGSTFNNASIFYLPGDATANDTRSCNFNSCGMIYPSSSVFAKNNIISADDRALTMIAEHKISSCSFIDCPSGVVINDSGTYTFDDLTFAGCTKDVVNASVSWVSANCVNGSNPSTYINTNGGTTAIVNAVYLTVNVENTSGYAISTAAVAIYSGSTELMNEFTSAAGQAQATYNYPGSTVPVTVRIRKSTPTSGSRYIPIKTTGTINANGFTLTSVMSTDSIAT